MCVCCCSCTKTNKRCNQGIISSEMRPDDQKKGLESPQFSISYYEYDCSSQPKAKDGPREKGRETHHRLTNAATGAFQARTHALMCSCSARLVSACSRAKRTSLCGVGVRCCRLFAAVPRSRRPVLQAASCRPSCPIEHPVGCETSTTTKSLGRVCLYEQAKRSPGMLGYQVLLLLCSFLYTVGESRTGAMRLEELGAGPHWSILPPLFSLLVGSQS